MVIGILCLLLTLYLMAIFARVILSWFPINPHGLVAAAAGFLYTVTDVVLEPLRRNVPILRLGRLGLDLSPLIVILGILLVRDLLGC